MKPTTRSKAWKSQLLSINKQRIKDGGILFLTLMLIQPLFDAVKHGVVVTSKERPTVSSGQCESVSYA